MSTVQFIWYRERAGEQTRNFMTKIIKFDKGRDNVFLCITLKQRFTHVWFSMDCQGLSRWSCQVIIVDFYLLTRDISSTLHNIL